MTYPRYSEYELETIADERGITVYREGDDHCYFYRLTDDALRELPDDFDNAPIGPFSSSLAALRAALEDV